MSASVAAFQAAFTNPLGTKPLSDFAARQQFAEFYMAWYDGSVMDPALPYLGQLKSALRLYRWTRITWNPFPDLCDFWAGIMYPGEIGEGDEESAIPLLPAKGAGPLDDALLRAILQVWAWSDMGSLKSDFPRHAAINGSAFIQCVDLPERGKVFAELVRMSYLRELELDIVGNVRRYVLEYKQIDPKSQKEYVVRKEVTKEAFRTYRDDKPYDYTAADRPPKLQQGSEWENPYGFVPAVFWPFRRSVGGSPWGGPAIGAHLGELARINSLESHLDDQLHKAINPINLIWAKGNLAALTSKEKKRGRTNDRTGGAAPAGSTRYGPDATTDDNAAQEEIRFYQGEEGGSVSKIGGSPEAIAEARQYIVDAKGNVKDAFPELSLYKELRAMTQVTGPAAEILLGDTKADVVERRSSLDLRMVRLTQMLISMSAYRYHLPPQQGGWRANGPFTSEQEVFEPFTNPQSYDSGALAFRIGPRSMVPEAPLTERERVELADIRQNKLGMPRGYVWEEAGAPDEVVTVGKEQDAEKEKAARSLADNLQVAGQGGVQQVQQQPGQSGQQGQASEVQR